MKNEQITDSEATMMSFCIWRGVHETKLESNEIAGEVSDPLSEDMELVRIALAMVKPEYHDIMKGTLSVTINDIREGRL